MDDLGLWVFGFQRSLSDIISPCQESVGKESPVFFYLHCCAKSFKFHVFLFIKIFQLFPEPFSETFRQCLFLGSVSLVFLQQFQSFRSYIKFFEIF